ncbi:MAG: hypothetical protein J7L64_08695 [Acidobacteria bacterium]|nr:hypothetical protein [Acidobacteriota bacterium]
MRRNLLLGVILAVLLFLEGSTEPASLQKETFTLKYREVGGAALAIKPFLSSRGSILIKPTKRIIEVIDSKENLKLVEKKIEEYDIPPRDIELKMEFIFASRNETNRGNSSEIKEVAARLSSFLAYRSFQLAEDIKLTAIEGKPFRARGRGFHLTFYPEVVGGKVVRLKDFTLFQVRKLPNGRFAYRRLFRGSLNIKGGTPFILGLLRDEGSDKALFILLKTSFGKER